MSAERQFSSSMSPPTSPTAEKGSLSLRRGSQSKKQMKGKIIQIYEAFFRGDDPSNGNVNFWEELFLLKANTQYIESEIGRMNGDQLVNLKETINNLFYKCVETLSQDNNVRRANAIQTLCALLRAVFSHSPASGGGFAVIDILIGFDTAESTMQMLIELINDILLSDAPSCLKSLVLGLLLVLATLTDNVSENTLLEYVMMNSVFESIIQVLGSAVMRLNHGQESVLLLTILVQYRKYETANPYIVKLSILDDELALTGYSHVVSTGLLEYNRQYQQKVTPSEGGFLSAITSMVGSMFVTEEAQVEVIKGNDSLLLALYEAIHLNRNFITALTHSHTQVSIQSSPALSSASNSSSSNDTASQGLSEVLNDASSQPTNLFVTFLEYCSIIVQDIKDPARLSNTKLCFIILTCIVEDQYANSLMHDVNMNFRVTLHRMPMRHRKGVTDKNVPSRPLASAVLGFNVRLITKEMMSEGRHLANYLIILGVTLYLMGKVFKSDTRDKSFESSCLIENVASGLRKQLRSDLMVEFISSHMMKNFPMELYSRCLGITHRILCYQKKCRVRLSYPWKDLWTAIINLVKFILSNESSLVKKHDIFQLATRVVNIFNLFITYGDTFLPNPNSYDELYYEIIRMHQVFDNLYSMAMRYTTTEGQWKDSGLRLTNTLVNIRAIVNHFNPKVESWSISQQLSSLTEQQVLDVVRNNYDSLTLKMQDNLDLFERYSEKPKEMSFFSQLMRGILADVRKSTVETFVRSANVQSQLVGTQ